MREKGKTEVQTPSLLFVFRYEVEMVQFFYEANISERIIICNILAQPDLKLCLFVPPENCNLHGPCSHGQQPHFSSDRKQKLEVLDKKFTLGIVAAQASTN